MRFAGTTAPQCCELSFNYFIVLLTGCSSFWVQPGFIVCLYQFALEGGASNHDHVLLGSGRIPVHFRKRDLGPAEAFRGRKSLNAVQTIHHLLSEATAAHRRFLFSFVRPGAKKPRRGRGYPVPSAAAFVLCCCHADRGRFPVSFSPLLHRPWLSCMSCLSAACDAAELIICQQ